ncbi:unnamed protein product, partial [Prorocentrum cordatum]
MARWPGGTGGPRCRRSCRRPALRRFPAAGLGPVTWPAADPGCRELIFDGNGGGGIWSPLPWETGCWAQGVEAQ